MFQKKLKILAFLFIILRLNGLYCGINITYSEKKTENIKNNTERKKTILFSFNLGFNTKLHTGVAYEYVFDIAGDMVSRLEWQSLPTITIGGTIEFLLKNGFHTAFSADFYFPKKVGKMSDKDFLHIKERPLLIKFSEHDNFLSNGMYFDFIIGWKKILFENNSKNIKIYIEPVIGLNYFFNKWQASDGYIQYADISKSIQEVSGKTPKIFWKGKAVSYKQKILLPNIGLFFTLNLPKTWSITTGLQLSSQVLAACKDTHHARNLIFYDIFYEKGFSLYLKLRAEKVVKKRLIFFISLNYDNVISYNGETVQYNMILKKPELKTVKGTSGTAFYNAGISTGFYIKFGNYH